MRPLIEAAQRNDELMRQAAEALTFNAPALELAKELTAASDAMKDVLRVDTSMLDIGKTMAGQMDAAAAFKSALQIDTSAFDALKNVTFASDAMWDALQVDTSAFTAATKALSMQAETAAAMKAALHIDTSALDWAKTIAPQFDTVRPLVTALQRAVPEFPKLEISSGDPGGDEEPRGDEHGAAARGGARTARWTRRPDARRWRVPHQHRHVGVVPGATGSGINRSVSAPVGSHARALRDRVH